MNRAKVGILMGSESDLDTMQKAAKVLEEMGRQHNLTGKPKTPILQLKRRADR